MPSVRWSLCLAAALAGTPAGAQQKGSNQGGSSQEDSSNGQGTSSQCPNGDCTRYYGERYRQPDNSGRGGASGAGWKASYDTGPEVFGVYRSSRYVPETSDPDSGSAAGKTDGRQGGRPPEERPAGTRKPPAGIPLEGARPAPAVGPGDLEDARRGGPLAAENDPRPELTEEEARANFESAVRAETGRCDSGHCSLRDTVTKASRKVRLVAVDEDSVVAVKDDVYRGLARYADAQGGALEALLTVDMSGALWRVTAVEFQTPGAKPAAPKVKKAAKRR